MFMKQGNKIQGKIEIFFSIAFIVFFINFRVNKMGIIGWKRIKNVSVREYH